MDHKELRERSATFAKDVGKFAKPLLCRADVRNAAGQLIRSAESVAANYRAAGLGRSDVEFVSTMGIVRTESDESVYWLLNLADAGYPEPRLIKEARELAKIFAASYRTARANLEKRRSETRAKPRWPKPQQSSDSIDR